MNPYRIEGPAVISFSFGRTSAFMLYKIIEAHGGMLPDDVHVCFMNTGKECQESLNFGQACAERWNVRVRWLEFRRIPIWLEHHDEPTVLAWSASSDDGRRLSMKWTKTQPEWMPRTLHTFEEVTYDSASRNGEPFSELIAARGYLPNPVLRFCTQELKVRPLRDFCRWELNWDSWTNVVGLRADEPRRVAKMRAPSGERWDVDLPLADAGVRESDVLDFWSRQPFDLELKSHEGNCDLCFLKGRAKRARIMRARPDLARWWIDQEQGPLVQLSAKPRARRFRADEPSYAQQLRAVLAQPELPGLLTDEEDGSMPCVCHD